MPDVELETGTFQTGSNRRLAELTMQHCRRDVGQCPRSNMDGVGPRSRSQTDGLLKKPADKPRIIHPTSSAGYRRYCTRIQEASRLSPPTVEPAMRIVFVCTGNICRSPYAEYLARDLTGSPDLEFASAGTIARAGTPAFEGGLAVAAELGIDLTPHRATHLTSEVVAQADIIYGMEDEHVEAVLQLAPNARVELLRPDAGGIPDPYGEDRQAYLEIYELIETALLRRLEELNSGRSSMAEEP